MTGPERLAPPLVEKWALPEGVLRLAVDDTGRAFASAPPGLVAVAPSGSVLWRDVRSLDPVAVLEGGVLAEEGGRLPALELLEPLSGRVAWRQESSLSLILCSQRLSRCVFKGRGARPGNVVVRLTTLPPGLREIWAAELELYPVSGTVDRVCVADASSVYVLCHGSESLDARVVALDLGTGCCRWTFWAREAGGGASPSMWAPSLDGDFLVFQAGGNIACVDTRTGRLLWKAVNRAGLEVAEERVYVTHGTSKVCVLGLRDGSVHLERDVSPWLRRRHRANYLVGRPAISGTHVFSADASGCLWAFDRSTGEAVWNAAPSARAVFPSNTKPLIRGGRLFIATYSLDPNNPQHLYCFEQERTATMGQLAAVVSVVGDGEPDRERDPLAFEVIEVLPRRTLAERAPYHKPGRRWTFYRCRMSTGGGEFLFGEKATRRTALGTFGQSVLLAASAKDADALLKAFRKALGKRRPGGERPARRIMAPTVMGSFSSLVAKDVPELRKLTSVDGSAELLLSWDPLQKRGAFLEKDEVYRDAVVRLIAGLAVR